MSHWQSVTLSQASTRFESFGEIQPEQTNGRLISINLVGPEGRTTSLVRRSSDLVLLYEDEVQLQIFLISLQQLKERGIFIGKGIGKGDIHRIGNRKGKFYVME